ncbi:MAG: NADH-quinone oxidoreductase subunit J, partial [Thermoguttaceae bacterium]|nr:NADH-quinone oxidoreductase subunit J [Thermoguttaceae bacterium]
MNANQTVVTVATVFAALGLWLLLPRAGRPGRMSGAVLAAIAAGLFFAEVPRLGTWMADGLFFVIAGVTLVAATATITVRNPVYAALWFGLMLVGVAGLFLFQGAQFLAAATIVVYAGAILVTFLFTLMLAQPKGRAPYDRISWEALLSATSGAMIVGVLSL